jgi:hypothetical protein
MIENAPYALHDFDISDAQVRLLSDDVAVLAYNVHEALDGGKASRSPSTPRPPPLGYCATAAGYALHTESLLGDPFGRDRRPTK